MLQLVNDDFKMALAISHGLVGARHASPVGVARIRGRSRRGMPRPYGLMNLNRTKRSK